MTDPQPRPLEELRRELLRCAQEQPHLARAWSAPPSRHPRRRFRLQWLGAAAGAVLVIVVAVGALVLLGHSSQHRHRAATAPIGCTALLRSQLAVFARPQTATDRDFTPPTHPGSGNSHDSDYTLVPALTRLARTLPGGARVYLAAYTPTATPETADGDLIGIYTSVRRGRPARLAGEVLPIVLSATALIDPQLAGDTLYTLVPNDVREVTWTFSRQVIVGSPDHANQVLHGGTVTGDVKENIAAGTALTDASLQPTRSRWLDADGQTLKTLRNPHPQRVTPSSHTTVATGTATATPLPTTPVCQP